MECPVIKSSDITINLERLTDNGFLLDIMLASGGYRWTSISKDIRDDCMTALEKASVDEDIREFARLLPGIILDNK